MTTVPPRAGHVDVPQGAASSDAAVGTQAEISTEIGSIAGDYENGLAAGAPAEATTRLDYPPYRSSLLRHPTKALHQADPDGVELWSPTFGHLDVDDVEADLTVQEGGEPIGERMVVTGRVVDGDGRPVRHQLVEVWQANASGRYVHQRDQHPAPLDPHFTGVGRCLTDDEGRYRFTTIKPVPTRGRTTATPGGRRTSTSRSSGPSSPSGS